MTEFESTPLNELIERSREERQLAREIRAAKPETIFELAAEAQVRQIPRQRRDAARVVSRGGKATPGRKPAMKGGL